MHKRRRIRIFTGVYVFSIPVSSFLIHNQQLPFLTTRQSLIASAMKSNSTEDSEGRNSAGRLDSTASAAEQNLGVTEEGLDMDEYCSVMDDFGCIAFEEVDSAIEEYDKKKTRLIRVQASADACLGGISNRDEVWLKIEQVKQIQSEYGRADLYERTWQSQADGDYINSIPINGEMLRSFTAMQFNTLAEGLSSGPTSKTPFPCDYTNKDDEKNCFGGFTEIKHPEIALDFNLRRWRLLEVILGSSSREKGNDPPFDLIAMEEVDRYRGFFAPVLNHFGYQGIFTPKFRAPGIQLGWYSDGCALFWKTSTFDLVSERRLRYHIGNQAFIIATLHHKGSNRHIVVGVTHLKARKSVNNEKIRMRQVCELLDKLEEERERIQTDSDEKEVPTLILGDFNADPPSKDRDKSCVAKVLDHHEEAFCPSYLSAYPIDPPPKGFFTTWKTRGVETVKRVIDYIFHSNMSCTDTLCVPDEKEIEVDQLPSLRYPSDHLMVAARFRL
jgi:mRNA deadenylase 3'-5' endonuclease subunit Ccr4